jgi:hypothetical protein
MLSWRGVVDGGAGLGGFAMMLLLDGVRTAPGASPGTTLDQQLVQVSERRHRHTRRAELHPGAGDRVEHPRRDDRDHAGRHLDVHEAAGETILAVVPPDAPPVQRMPAVIDDGLLPDMGRMTP